MTPPCFVCFWRDSPQWARASSFTRLLDHTQRRTTVGRTPLDEWSARRRDLFLTTQHSQQTNVHAPGWIRTHNLSRRVAADLRLRRRGHWDRLFGRSSLQISALKLGILTEVLRDFLRTPQPNRSQVPTYLKISITVSFSNFSKPSLTNWGRRGSGVSTPKSWFTP